MKEGDREEERKGKGGEGSEEGEREQRMEGGSCSSSHSYQLTYSKMMLGLLWLSLPIILPDGFTLSLVRRLEMKKPVSYAALACTDSEASTVLSRPSSPFSLTLSRSCSLSLSSSSSSLSFSLSSSLSFPSSSLPLSLSLCLPLPLLLPLSLSLSPPPSSLVPLPLSLRYQDMTHFMMYLPCASVCVFASISSG